MGVFAVLVVSHDLDAQKLALEQAVGGSVVLEGELDPAIDVADF